MADAHQWGDFFAIAAKNILKRRLRSWLTMIGIFIGIAAVVALVSLGQGLESAIDAEFQNLGMNRIFVSSAGSIFGAGGVISLTDSDYDVIEKVKGVDRVAGYMFSTAKIEWGDELRWQVVVGVPDDQDQIDYMDELYTLEKGRWFRPGEKYKAVVGYDFATHPAFEEHLEIGDKVSINGVDFEVVGSFEKIGNSQDDRTIVIPMDVARKLLDVPDRIDSFMIDAKPGENVSAVADRIEKAMRKDRGQKEGEEDFTVQTFQEYLDSFMVILDIVTAVLVGIAAVSLLVGAIGIMNTMYTSVLERTKEIGIMKAIGARNSDVLLLFMIESGLLGIAGGLIGILLGAGLSSFAAYAAQTFGGFEYLKAQFPFWLIFGALAFSFLVGVAFGSLPARQASRKNPVDSLRYE